MKLRIGIGRIPQVLMQARGGKGGRTEGTYIYVTCHVQSSTPIVGRVGMELKISEDEVNIKAEPYKTLVHEEGTFFKPHAE